jgi:hypothetical protein
MEIKHQKGAELKVKLDTLVEEIRTLNQEHPGTVSFLLCTLIEVEQGVVCYAAAEGKAGCALKGAMELSPEINTTVIFTTLDYLE